MSTAQKLTKLLLLQPSLHFGFEEPVYIYRHGLKNK